MSTFQALGALLVSLPFLALAVYAVTKLGWRETLLVFGGVAATIAIVLLGSLLLTGAIGA